MDQFSHGDIFVGETIGTAILILLGAGVVAAVNLRFSKAKEGGWIVVAFGWGFGVMAGAYTAGPLSGGHINPAVTLGIAISDGGSASWERVPTYLAGQLLGALIGAVLCWAAYYAHFQANRDSEHASPTVGIFATEPAIRQPPANAVTEIVATTVLVLPLLAFGETKSLGPGHSGTGTLLVAFLVVGIGLSLGGPTGYAINPARDLGPRIAHALLPIPNKGSSDWAYAWVPVVGPLAGGALGALLYEAAF
ncbi:MIP/aquaporin family protein [Streptomyces boncukensis]|uniref:Aquaporin family protein n=1 Tax=Streptomyces boncukensis TaxID=2711219 RepID=A0A6G4X219_9ACTN|nr:MIP/aquaporin family protein [Streptomyces boncukensis]NGO71589.1 aquaporin family protein [Streptomyces boncukensis]